MVTGRDIAKIKGLTKQGYGITDGDSDPELEPGNDASDPNPRWILILIVILALSVTYRLLFQHCQRRHH